MSAASSDAGQHHYEQATAFLADAESGQLAYTRWARPSRSKSPDVPMTRDQQFAAASTHALLALYLELRTGRGVTRR